MAKQKEKPVLYEVRYFRRRKGWKDRLSGCTIMIAGNQIFVLKPDKAALDVSDGLTRRYVLEQLLAGHWVELNRPAHKRGDVIKRYRMLPQMG